MKKLLAALLLATAVVSAQATETWEASFRKCDLGKTFAKDDTITAYDGSTVFVTITPEDIPAIEKGIAVLKQCRKFWTCVSERNAGKMKHCYMPKDRR
jgi:uncharacterized cupredoxin-like copper-binding protein